MRPIHDEEPWATTTSLARVMADDKAVVGTSAPAVVTRAAAAVATVVVFEASILQTSHHGPKSRQPSKTSVDCPLGQAQHMMQPSTPIGWRSMARTQCLIDSSSL